MPNSGSHSRRKTGRMDTLLKALECVGKFLQIVSLVRHL
jgi:hypothetical protein